MQFFKILAKYCHYLRILSIFLYIHDTGFNKAGKVKKYFFYKLFKFRCYGHQLYNKLTIIVFSYLVKLTTRGGTLSYNNNNGQFRH